MRYICINKGAAQLRGYRTADQHLYSAGNVLCILVEVGKVVP